MMKSQRGYTLTEILLVLTIVGILLGFATINLANSQRTASLATAEQELLSSLRQQQLKAMVGDTEGRMEQNSYGIHFDSDEYILFHGTYSSTDSANFTVEMANNLQFNPAGTEIIFQKVSGEISATSSSILIEDTTNGESKTISVNKYGVVIQGD